jgi:hypothetical protein
MAAALDAPPSPDVRARAEALWLVGTDGPQLQLL